MKRKLIIHVGMGKTGSSSIQQTLRTSKNILQNNGFKYLGLMLEQHRLSEKYAWQVVDGWEAFLALTKREVSEQLVSVLEEIDRSLPSSIHTLIWSNESFFNEAERFENALETLKSTYDIEIVGYIRKPDSWVQSAYLQWGIKHKSYMGGMKKFTQWVRNRKFVVTPFINRWRSLDKTASFYNFEPIKDICQHFLGHHVEGVVTEVKLQRANETPSSVALAFFAYHNSRFNEHVLPNDLHPLLDASGVLSKQLIMPDFNNMLPDSSDINAFIENNKAEVAELNSYFKGSGQQEFDTSEVSCKDYSVTQQDINRGLLQLVVHLSREIDQLKKNRQ